MSTPHEREQILFELSTMLDSLRELNHKLDTTVALTSPNGQLYQEQRRAINNVKKWQDWMMSQRKRQLSTGQTGETSRRLDNTV